MWKTPPSQKTGGECQFDSEFPISQAPWPPAPVFHRLYSLPVQRTCSLPLIPTLNGNDWKRQHKSSDSAGRPADAACLARGRGQQSPALRSQHSRREPRLGQGHASRALMGGHAANLCSSHDACPVRADAGSTRVKRTHTLSTAKLRLRRRDKAAAPTRSSRPPASDLPATQPLNLNCSPQAPERSVWTTRLSTPVSPGGRLTRTPPPRGRAPTLSDTFPTRSSGLCLGRRASCRSAGARGLGASLPVLPRARRRKPPGPEDAQVRLRRRSPGKRISGGGRRPPPAPGR